MKYLNNSNSKNSKTLGYSLILDVNPNLYSRNNPKSWVIHTLGARLKKKRQCKLEEIFVLPTRK